MAENRSCGPSGSTGPLCRDSVCIDCGRVLDSCKDKDCFTDVRVRLTGCGQELIEKTSSVRVRSAEIAGANIDLEPVPFNRGFYQIFIRYFVHLCLEGCLGPGRAQEFEGVAVCDKKVILYGSEGSVNIFRSSGTSGSCGMEPVGIASTNLPTAVVETVDPVTLSIRVVDPSVENCPSCCSCGCSCGCGDIPANICSQFADSLIDGGENDKYLAVSLGFFSVVRIERPGQYLIQASEYNVPEKECVAGECDDPCTLFEKMAFPVSEFSPPTYRQMGGCGCDGRK